MRPLLAAVLVFLAGCGVTSQPTPGQREPLETAMITGSAESPDPVLEKVMALEKSGVVEDVVVHESFPVQIRLRAPKSVIDELNAMPRVGGQH